MSKETDLLAFEDSVKNKGRRYKMALAAYSGVITGVLISTSNYPWFALPIGAFSLWGVYSMDYIERATCISGEILSHQMIHTHKPILDELIFQQVQRRRGMEKIDVYSLRRVVDGFRGQNSQLEVLGDEPFWFAVRSKKLSAAKELVSPTLELIAEITGQRPERSDIERETTHSIKRVKDLLPLI